MIDFPLIDSHVHLLDPVRLSYGWTRHAPSLNRLARPKDLVAAAAPFEIERIVFVEVDVDEGQHLAEAAWVADEAAADPRVGAMVAALPVEKGTAIEDDLDVLRRHAILRGVRRLIQNQP